VKNTRFIVILLAVVLPLFFFGLGKMALTDPDETFYAQTAQEMLDAGEWSTPIIFGEAQFEKPILYYWLVIGSYKVFGVNEFAARFPSAVLGVIGVAGVYLLGRLFFSSRTGLFSALILATCMEYVVLSRACVTDMALMVFVLFCMLFFLGGWIKGKRHLYFFSAAMAALAVLTKGPIGLFIPVVTIGLYVLLSRQWKKIKDVPFGWCALIFLAICLPWYITAARIHGAVFINEFFGFQNITRFLKPEHRIGTSPFFYFPVVLGGFFPWSIFLPMAAWHIYKERNAASRVKAHGLFLAAWFLVVFVFFSISRTKLVTYIFPLFPVMAVVTGRFWERFVAGAEDSVLRKHMKISFTVFIAVSIVALAGICLFVGFYKDQRYIQALSGTVLTGAVFAAGLVVSWMLFIRGKKSSSFYAIVLTVVLASFPLILRILPEIEKIEASKVLSLEVKKIAAPGEAIGGESDHCRGVAFYTGRTDIVDIHPFSSLKAFLSREERVWCIIQRKHYEQMVKFMPGKVSEPLFESGKYVVVTNKPGSEETGA